MTLNLCVVMRVWERKSDSHLLSPGQCGVKSILNWRLGQEENPLKKRRKALGISFSSLQQNFLS